MVGQFMTFNSNENGNWQGLYDNKNTHVIVEASSAPV